MPTKRQIEESYPIVKPEECPGKVMEWVSKKLKDHDKVWTEKIDKAVQFATGWLPGVIFGLLILSILNTIILLIHINIS
jgi:hypothetical protein